MGSMLTHGMALRDKSSVAKDRAAWYRPTQAHSYAQRHAEQRPMLPPERMVTKFDARRDAFADAAHNERYLFDVRK